MSQSPKSRDTHMERERDAPVDDVVYFVKRPLYEFALTIAKTRSRDLNGAAGLSGTLSGTIWPPGEYSRLRSLPRLL
jgi:hypothetical protein